jgi:hypothetical protein
MILSLVSSLVPMLVLAAIVAGIVGIARRDEDHDDEPGIGTVRRLVLYGLAFVAAMIAPTGIGLLVGGLFEAITGGIVIAESDTELAVGLSLSLVGAVAWGILWRIAIATVERHPVERRSVARHLYFLAVRAAAYIAMMVAGATVLWWAMRIEPFDGNGPGFLLVAAGVWYAHERMQAPEALASPATRSIGRLYLFGASFVGLAVFATGLGSLLSDFLNDAYDAAFGRTINGGEFSPFSRAVRESLSITLVGAVGWGAHWWRARPDYASTVWRVYIFLGGLLSGITTAIVGASVVLYLTLQWFFGAPRNTSAVLHFVTMPEAVAGLIIGVLLWGYHRSVLAEHAREVAAPPSETERVYRYLAAAAGLVTLVSGLARVLATAFDLLGGEDPAMTASPGWWQNQLVTGVTLLLVGIPLWLRYWRHVEAHTAAGGAVERAALSRRIFLYGVFGASGIATLIALSTVLFELFQGLLGGTLSLRIFHDARWAFAVLLSAAGAALYYWQILRADQRAQPEAAAPAQPRVRDVVVVGSGDVGALAHRIEQRLGSRVRPWQRADATDATLEDAALEALLTQLESTSAERVLVVIAPGGAASVVPYTTR